MVSFDRTLIHILQSKGTIASLVDGDGQVTSQCQALVSEEQHVSRTGLFCQRFKNSLGTLANATV